MATSVGAYYRSVIRAAFTHSIHITHGIIFVLIIAAGAVGFFSATSRKYLEGFDVGGWEIGAGVLGAILLVRLAAAPFWLHAEEAKQLADARKTLKEISEERPFTFVTIDCMAVGNNFHTVPTWDVKRVNLMFENLSKRLLRFKVRTLGLEYGGNTNTIEIPESAGTHIHGEQRMTYGVDVSGIQTIHFPFVLTVSFDVHYDNVPPLSVRGTSRKVQYTVYSFRPVNATNVILEEAEYTVGWARIMK
jgi:hypothetical protein